MHTVEEQLKALIKQRYGNLKKFTEVIAMPWTTLDSILKRGVANSNISNIMKICKELEIDTESLVEGRIEPARSVKEQKAATVDTIAAHFDGDEFTEDELNEIRRFAEFVKSKRN